jgi:hypothetical protein
MAKFSMDTISAMLYDGTTPPEDFIQIFELQSIFMDWKDTDQLKGPPFFLNGQSKDNFSGRHYKVHD